MKKKLAFLIVATATIGTIIAVKKRNKTLFHIKSYDGRFYMSFSKHWKLSNKKNELNENSNLEAINSKNGICLIMFSKSKEELNNISLNEYNDDILHSIEENILNTNKIKINNRELYIIEFNSYYNNTLIHYILYTLSTENYYHQVMVAFINNKFHNIKNNKYFKEINNILSTLKEIN